MRFIFPIIVILSLCKRTLSLFHFAELLVDSKQFTFLSDLIKINAQKQSENQIILEELYEEDNEIPAYVETLISAASSLELFHELHKQVSRDTFGLIEEGVSDDWYMKVDKHDEKLDIDGAMHLENTNLQSGFDMLKSAIENDNLEELKFLIQNVGVNPNVMNADRETPFWLACSIGAKEIVVFLHQYVDINFSSSNGQTPLYIAAQNGHENIVNFLIDCGAIVHNLDKEGFSPFYVACMQGMI